MKRVAIAAVMSLVLLGASGRGLLARGGADIVSSPVSFVLTSAGCSNLPSGLVVTGATTETSVTETVIGHDGLPTFVNSIHANGTATDQYGNTYAFNYANQSRLTLDPSGTSISGPMTDSFSLAGRGPATLHNGFSADVTIDLNTNAFSATPRSSRGDPIDFTTGTAHCDPL